MNRKMADLPYTNFFPSKILTPVFLFGSAVLLALGGDERMHIALL
jgi:hypothetical protein